MLRWREGTFEKNLILHKHKAKISKCHSQTKVSSKVGKLGRKMKMPKEFNLYQSSKIIEINVGNGHSQYQGGIVLSSLIKT